MKDEHYTSISPIKKYISHVAFILILQTCQVRFPPRAVWTDRCSSDCTCAASARWLNRIAAAFTASYSN